MYNKIWHEIPNNLNHPHLVITDEHYTTYYDLHVAFKLDRKTINFLYRATCISVTILDEVFATGGRSYNEEENFQW